MNRILNYIDSFINLFFPVNCLSCGESLLKQENCICTKCIYNLPKTNFHLDPDNLMSKIFWGRVRIEHATAFYFFFKGSLVQGLIHRLKYQGNKSACSEMGKLFGSYLKNSVFGEIDVIVPVPLHPTKLRKRGYNQSEALAVGMAEALNKPVYRDVLKRKESSETQTRKSRIERWENVEHIFSIHDGQKLKGNHVLLVDDVVTTGATLEACANLLLSVGDVKISIATLAISSR